METVRLGQLLAERHAEGAELDPRLNLLNYAEAPYEGDWTLRSALMRLAQPHPKRVGQVLDLTRRVDAPLHHVRKVLEGHVVITDQGLTAEGLDSEPQQPRADIRTADLARLVAAGFDHEALLSGYEQDHELDHEERLAIPLLVVALSIEELAATLATWALAGPANPPLDAVDQFVETVTAKLDDLGVPKETGPPPGMRRSGRG